VCVGKAIVIVLRLADRLRFRYGPLESFPSDLMTISRLEFATAKTRGLDKGFIVGGLEPFDNESGYQSGYRQQWGGLAPPQAVHSIGSAGRARTYNPSVKQQKAFQVELSHI
jgi:hypothetical protein